MIPNTFAAFFSKLSWREKTVLYFAAGAIGLAALDRLVIDPVVSKMRLLDERIKVEQELIRKNSRILAEKDRVKDAVGALSSYSRNVSSQEEEIAFLLGEVEKLARKTSLYIVDMKPLGVQEDSVSRKYTVDLNCEAQMEQIINFMHEVESSAALFFVETFNISPKAKDSSIAKVNMRIVDIVFL